MFHPDSVAVTQQRDDVPLIDPASLACQRLLDQLAPTEATVLLCGETGTGKEVMARYLHQHSPRRHGPFLALNCGALSESLAEAELFGHEKGAYTGAQQGMPGWFEAASGGTLLLDEIGELSLTLQVKLLRVLQEREITRVGSRSPRKIDVRVIAATHVDLRQAIAGRRFREDLYHRLNIATLSVPALRQRRQDILPLADHFLRLYGQRFGRPTVRLSAPARQRLLDYAWPGNVRELENTLHRAVLMNQNGEIDSADLWPLSALPAPVMEPSVDEFTGWLRRQLQSPPPQLYERVVRRLIEAAMEHEGGNQSHAAALLGISRQALRTQLAHLGVIKGRRRCATGARVASQGGE
ncbi:sigma-54-dependent Fis family transcriptional regulator [Shimwellia pseudoproteus]|nr:sigma-54-dependent Fis family transcriptional regulator [Shimwellia pseudoproteus]